MMLRRHIAAAVLTVVVAGTMPVLGQGPAKAPATFTKDIAPILQRKCQQCHRPDPLAPMSLIAYEDARPYARAIKQRTALRDKPGVMPPLLTFADDSGWKMGTPDLIVSSPTVELKSLAPDWFGVAGEAPTNLTEDWYVAALEIREVNDSRGKTSDRTNHPEVSV